MTEISTNRKIGIFAPSGYGKTYLVDKLVASIGTKVCIYDTDYEAQSKGYFKSPNVEVYSPKSDDAEDLNNLNSYLQVITAKYTNVVIYVEDLDVFFDEGSSLSRESRLLKNIASKGRHHRIGFIYSAKQLAFVPTKLIGNTNLFYIGQFIEKNDVERLKNFVTFEELQRLKEHEFWKIDRSAKTKTIVKV